MFALRFAASRSRHFLVRLMSTNTKENIPAAALQQRPEDTIFQKIINKEVPSRIVYEDDRCMAIHDIAPVAPTHILILPKRPIAGVASVDASMESDLGHLFVAAKEVAKQVGLHDEGYRLVVNQGPNGLQSVNWLHVHLIGGKKLSWPPGVPQ